MSDISKYVSHHSRSNGIEYAADGSVFRENILLLNGSVLPNAPYFTLTWYCCPGDPKTETHTHDFDEYLGFAGSDPESPEKLNGLVRFMIDDEWVTIDKSTVLFIPAGIKHCPYVIERVERPIIHWSGGDTRAYEQIK